MCDMNHRERFSTNLKEARAAAGITQDEIADRCGIHRTEVSLLERAGREPRLGTLIKLADGLGTTIAELCKGLGEGPPKDKTGGGKEGSSR